MITANGLVQRTRDDDTYEFHQDANFWYLSGIEEPNFILVIDKDKDYLIGPELNERWKIFHGDMDLDAFSRVSGVDETLPATSGWQKLSKKLKKSRHVATLAPSKAFDDTFLVYTNPAKRHLAGKLRSHNKDLKLIDISKQLADLRTVKQGPEIAAIQKAIDETIETYKILGKKIDKYKSEREVSAEIDYIFNKKGLKPSFRQIVAGGKNAVTLHYHKNDAPIDQGEILLVDMGVIHSGYCSDLTRSIIRTTKRQLDVYAAVCRSSSSR